MSRIAAVLAVAALGVAGCSGGGSAGSSGSIGGSKPAGKPGGTSVPAGVSLQGPVPSGFSGATTWSTQVTWAKSGIGKPTLGSEYEQVSDWVVARQQADLGVARTVGGSVVTSSFSSGGAAGPVVTTLKFLDAKTGKPLAEKALPPGTFLGLSADTVAGKPVAVVRYLTAQDAETPVVVVFDESGTQVWSSQGQQLATGLGLQGAAGLQHGENGAGLIVGGYMLRTNLGKDTSFNSDSSYDVLDTSGKSLLHVPFYADRVDQNAVVILQGYAVVWYDDSLSLSDSSQAKEHFAVYDLAAGGKKVGDLVENGSGGIALVAFHGKVLLSWAGKSVSGGNADQMTVLDTATGQTTPPVPGPGDVGGGTVIDPATSNVLFYDNSDSPSSGSVMVSLTKGTVLWTQKDNHGALVPLSLHNGVVYGIEAGELGSTQGSQLAVKETDGSPADSDYELSPLDFTADGAPLFAEAGSDVASDTNTDTDTVTVGVGHSG